MNNVSYAEILKTLRSEQQAIEQLPKVNIVVLSNVTIEPFLSYLRYFVYQLGFNASLALGEYDNIYQEALGIGRAVIDQHTEFVIVYMRLEGISWNLSRSYCSLTGAEIKVEQQRIQTHVAEVVSNIRERTRATILWHSLEQPLSPAFGILDFQKKEGQSRVIEALNRNLRAKLETAGNAFALDMGKMLMRLGADNFYDQRYWHLGRSPYSRKGAMELARENVKFIAAQKGKNKKCLVLDCDDILWGGVIGEDELVGIKLGQNHPGSAFYEFQQEVVNLYHRGVIIALCSKNNHEDVLSVIRGHPDMLLTEKYIAATRINWLDKVTNLRALAMELNIGLESMVFVDDSSFEVNFVRESLPMISVLHLPVEHAYHNRDILASCGLFDALSYTDEDKTRGAMYKTETDRALLRKKQPTLQSYLLSLEMRLKVDPCSQTSVPRIAQLTQKTNQFTLTTKRYTDQDIQNFCADSDKDVLSLSLEDKIGDMGLVGVCIMTYDRDMAEIDTFLLSCRVLGRAVEDVFLLECLAVAKSRGSRVVFASYCPTKKNSQTAEFFPNQGFSACSGMKAYDEARYMIELDSVNWSTPDCFGHSGAVKNNVLL
jgi:FkbH-like protein